MILAIDQATTTGWAYCEPGAKPEWGHERVGARGDWEGEIFTEFRALLCDLIDRFSPRCLAFEAPFVPRPNRSPTAQPLNPNVLRRAFGLVGHLLQIADDRDLQCEEIQSVEFTKFFTGKGRFAGETSAARTHAKKSAVVAACKARGWDVTHDEADALALLMCVEYRLYPAASLSRRITLKQPVGSLFT